MKNDEIKDVVNNEDEEKVEVIESSEKKDVDSEGGVEEKNVLLSDESKEDDEKEIKEPSLIKRILCNVLDQTVLISVSSIALIVFDFLIKFIGYMVVMPLGVLLIIYFIANSIYVPILKKSKFKRTLGEKIFNI
ncbi:MAG: RDD family protein [Clostridium butyricum]|nr:RDD family protein [Clostridium butyricum]